MTSDWPVSCCWGTRGGPWGLRFRYRVAWSVVRCLRALSCCFQTTKTTRVSLHEPTTRLQTHSFHQLWFWHHFRSSSSLNLLIAYLRQRFGQPPQLHTSAKTNNYNLYVWELDVKVRKMIFPHLVWYFRIHELTSPHFTHFTHTVHENMCTKTY